jgi:hypothetical protein
MPDSTTLKKAIVTTLENRPNTSCKVDTLPAYVLRTLGDQARGSRRKRIIANLNRAVGDLKRARIVEEYVATNRRVRLSRDYGKRWEAHLKRTRHCSTQSGQIELFPNPTKPISPESWSDDESDLDGDLDEIRTLSLPPLPEAKYKPESVELSDDDPVSISRTTEDDEVEGILDSLLHPNRTSDDAPPESPEEPDRLPDEGLWRKLGDALSGREDYAVECFPGGMQILFTTRNSTDVVEIGLLNAQGLLRMTSFLPFREGVALQLLHLTDDSAWTSIPSVTNDGGLLKFSFRRSLHATRAPVDEIAAQLDCFISEVKRARMVISYERL